MLLLKNRGGFSGEAKCVIAYGLKLEAASKIFVI